MASSARRGGSQLALIIVAAFAVALALYARDDRWLPYLAGIYGVLSLLVLGLYGWDKRAAMRAGPRISEQSLHLLALAGGWPGAMLARPLFRHKTRKQPFTGLFWCTVLLNIAMLGVLVW
jgi:uncharacterized membrane protein YsdA (DUF1294 family)